ncbi:histidine phosphatase family protein [Mitsuaria sp. WAJ17]|uniref:histidine phosphatase family protein n=1 Tax=Mitsuaria sp. WAJ17 TaxID=2761452 RepID=UPI00160189DC|nr:histidine phosphatase family protein [Mitsuaria sp. WAJ17]MBB2485174.1 histidine phosphatase family protein [Mitsuaria sp. WAJ17]
MSVHRFTLIRHAQAACNVLAPDSPWTPALDDCALTPLGQQQANSLAAHWPTELYAPKLYVSPMRRARETAAPLARQGGMPLVLDERLAEVTLQGDVTRPLWQQDWDDILEQRIRQPDESPLSGVESLRAQFLRAQGFLKERLAAGGGHHMIVSHAQTLELLILSLLGLALEDLQRFRFRLSNTGVHMIECQTDGSAPRLMLVNSLAHLNRLV